MNAETLPNQRTTWAKLSSAVEEFDAWKQRKDRRYASDDAELLCYLTDQLQAEGASLAGFQMNHPVLGLLSHMSESNNRMQEVLFAYLSIVVSKDCEPARKMIAGQRLQAGLHPDYVAATRCYGSQEVLQASADSRAAKPRIGQPAPIFAGGHEVHQSTD